MWIDWSLQKYFLKYALYLLDTIDMNFVRNWPISMKMFFMDPVLMDPSYLFIFVYNISKVDNVACRVALHHKPKATKL